MKPEPYALDRGLPANLEAERGVLGAILLDNTQLAAAKDLTVEHFFLDSHRRIFARMCQLVEDQRRIDYVTLADALGRQQELEAIGGVAYLSSLTEGIPGRENLQPYVGLLAEAMRLRKIILLGDTAIRRALDREDSSSIIADLTGETTAIVNEASETDRDIFVPADRFINESHREIEWRVSGVIERGTNGFIFALPKAGKSFVTADLAVSLATGERWLEFKTKQCRVALVNREDYPGTTARRLRRVLIGKGLDADQRHFSDNLWVNSRAQAQRLYLDNPHHLATLIKNLQRRVIDFLILDVLNVLHDADENDNTEMRGVLKKIEHIRDEVGCEVCVVHHSKKNVDENASLTETARGSSAIGGFSEYQIGVNVIDEELGIRRMRFESKAAEAAHAFYWRIRDVAETGGVIVERADYEPQRNSRAKRALA